MRALLDEQLPVDLAPELHGHQVDTVVGRGWAGVKNSDLLRCMRGDYDIFVTMDRAASNRMRELRPLVPAILDAIAATKPGYLQRVGA